MWFAGSWALEFITGVAPTPGTLADAAPFARLPGATPSVRACGAGVARAGPGRAASAAERAYAATSLHVHSQVLWNVLTRDSPLHVGLQWLTVLSVAQSTCAHEGSRRVIKLLIRKHAWRHGSKFMRCIAMQAFDAKSTGSCQGGLSKTRHAACLAP